MSQFDFPKVLLGRDCQFLKRRYHTLLMDVAGLFKGVKTGVLTLSLAQVFERLFNIGSPRK
jgi:hypothetical protein